jgi:hypothetical protein
MQIMLATFQDVYIVRPVHKKPVEFVGSQVYNHANTSKLDCLKASLLPRSLADFKPDMLEYWFNPEQVGRPYLNYV